MRVSQNLYFILLSITAVFSLSGLWNFSRRPMLPGKVAFTAAEKVFYQFAESQSPQMLLKINDIPITKSYQIEAIVDHHQIGDTLRFEFQDGAAARVGLIRRNSPWHLLLNFLLGLTFISIATLVFRKHKDESEIFFSLSGLCFALILTVSWSGIQLHFALAALITVLYFLSYPQAFVLFYHFTNHFPAPSLSPRSIRIRFAVLQIIGFCFTLILLYAFFRRYFLLSQETIDFYQQTYRIFRAFILLTLIFALFNIIRNLRTLNDPVNRRKAMWLFWGVLWGSFPFIFLWSLPQLWGSPIIPEWVAHLFVLLVPISIAIAILRYRLFDIEIVLSRSVSYSLLLLLLASAYIFIAGSLSLLLIQQFSLESPYISVVTGVTVAFLFTPLRSRVQNIVDSKFFHIRYDRFRSLQDFLNQLEKHSRPEEILQILMDHFQAAVPLSWQQLLWRDSVVKTLGNGPLTHKKMLELLASVNFTGIAVNRLAQQHLEHDLPVSQITLANAAVIAIIHPPHLIWLWGEKESGQRFWKEDLDLGEEMARAALLQLQKIDYYQRSLKEAYRKEAAEKQSRWKSLLVAEVAHDLRAPLNTMLWKMNNLRTGLSEAGQGTELLGDLEQQLNRMQEFIHSLLILSDKSKRGAKIRREPVWLKQCVENVRAMLSSLLEGKKLRLEIQLPEGLYILGDPFLLQEVLLNLLQNSAKFSPPESCIRFTAEKVSRRGKEKIGLHISDEAGGIDKKMLSARFPAGATIQQWETGRQSFRLGLHIVQEFTRLLNGELRIRSQPGKGSTISLYFQPAHPETQ